MTLERMFDIVYALPVDEFGIHRKDGVPLIHVYGTGDQFNILGGGAESVPLWNIIIDWSVVDGDVTVIPVSNGCSMWDWARTFDIDDKVDSLPDAITLVLKEAGIR